jgi:outer membrane protein assembly factor BamB
VYAGTYDGKFYALDAVTGDTRWRREMPSAVHASPVVMGGLVYATTCSSCGSEASRAVKTGKDKSYAFSARNGRTRWRNNGGKYASAIIADQDRVYFTGRSRQYALEPRRKRSRKARANRSRRARARQERKRDRRRARRR